MVSIRDKNVSRETLGYIETLAEVFNDKLIRYAELLLWWNQKINLLSRNTQLPEIRNHINHSLIISGASTFPKQKSFADIGTGGGLPGIPLAICYPDRNFILLDRVQKKCTATLDIVKQLKLKNVKVVCSDLSMFHVEHKVAWISKHAIKIPDLLSLVGKNEWEFAYFLKGDDFREELDWEEYPIKIINWQIDTHLHDPFYEGKRLLEIQKII
jgi:16S rRNA (guanine527-N7)-methyltransferase